MVKDLLIFWVLNGLIGILVFVMLCILTIIFYKWLFKQEVMTMSKEYETIDIVKLRDLLETTRNIGRLLTEEEFNEIMTVYKKVIDRLCDEQERLLIEEGNNLYVICNYFINSNYFNINILIYILQGVVMTMSKDYETIDTVKQRDLLEITRNIGRLLTEEEFNEIMMIYKKVIDRLCDEQEVK